MHKDEWWTDDGLLQANTIKPQSYVVTRWQEDPFAGMAYSYIPVGRSGEIYDQLAAPVANKVFFAGEVISGFS